MSSHDDSLVFKICDDSLVFKIEIQSQNDVEIAFSIRRFVVGRPRRRDDFGVGPTQTPAVKIKWTDKEAVSFQDNNTQ